MLVCLALVMYVCQLLPSLPDVNNVSVSRYLVNSLSPYRVLNLVSHEINVVAKWTSHCNQPLVLDECAIPISVDTL